MVDAGTRSGDGYRNHGWRRCRGSLTVLNTSSSGGVELSQIDSGSVRW